MAVSLPATEAAGGVLIGILLQTLCSVKT